MSAVATTAGVLALALIADRLVGDPDWLWRRIPHPAALAGRLIEIADRRLNRPDLNRRDRLRRGVFVAVGLVAAAALAGLALDRVLGTGWRGSVAEAAVVAILLAHKSLLDHVGAVAAALETGSARAGREAVKRIVGRDVAALEERGIARAAIESLAENFSDGVVAPALWYLVGGLPALLAYKLVNTADSMIGHRSPRHADFGWAAARLDDLANLVPARVSALLITAAAWSRGARAAAAAGATAWRDARRHRSPNAGWPEAAMAGALGLRLGGPRSYGVETVDGAVLNPGGRSDAAGGDIRAAMRIADMAWLILLLAVAAPALLALWQG